MSKRRKKNHRNVVQQRLAAKTDDVWSVPDFLSTRPAVEQDNYKQLAEYMLTRPDVMRYLEGIMQADVSDMILGLAFGGPRLVWQPTGEQKRDLAAYLRMWHMTNHYESPFEHWPPIVAMTDQQIIEQVEKDVESGVLQAPPNE